VARPSAGGRGLHWILRDRLGHAVAGLVREETDDLRSLRRCVSTWSSASRNPRSTRSASRGRVRGSTLDRRQAPPRGCQDLCRRIARRIDDGRRRRALQAGLGRTGTMLACVLVQRGSEPVAAIHRVRSTNPLYIRRSAAGFHCGVRAPQAVRSGALRTRRAGSVPPARADRRPLSTPIQAHTSVSHPAPRWSPRLPGLPIHLLRRAALSADARCDHPATEHPRDGDPHPRWAALGRPTS
jgi:atypical dual specificity phosphatase